MTSHQLCKRCRSLITSGQHRLRCSICSLHYHRTCFQKLSRSEFTVAKTNWTCDECRPTITTTTNPNHSSPFQDLDITATPTEEIDEPRSEDFQQATIEILPEAFLKVKGIKFCHFNANSIRKKLTEINILLQQQNIGVLACSESK